MPSTSAFPSCTIPRKPRSQCAQPGRCGLCRDHSEGAAFPDRPRKHHFGCGKGVNYGLFTRTAMDMLMKTTHPEINRRQCWNLHPHRKPCTECKDICPYGEQIFTRPNLVKAGPLYRVRPVRLCLPQRLHHPSPEQVQRDTSAADTDNDTIWIAAKSPPAKIPWCAPALRPSHGRHWPTLP